MKISVTEYDSPRALNAARAAIQSLIDNPEPEMNDPFARVTTETLTAGTESPTNEKFESWSAGKLAPLGENVDPVIHMANGSSVEFTSHSAESVLAHPDTDGEFPTQIPTGAVIPDDQVEWDARIHASTKSRVKNGEWKRKRGISEELYESVMAELRAGNVDTVNTADPASVAFGGTTTTLEQKPTPTAGDLQWPDVIKRVMAGKQTEMVAQEQVNAKAIELGVANFPSLSAHPELWTQFLMELGI